MGPYCLTSCAPLGGLEGPEGPSEVPKDAKGIHSVTQRSPFSLVGGRSRGSLAARACAAAACCEACPASTGDYHILALKALK